MLTAAIMGLFIGLALALLLAFLWGQPRDPHPPYPPSDIS